MRSVNITKYKIMIDKRKMTMIRYKYNDTCRIERQKLGERKHGIHRDIPIKEAYNAVVAENGRYLIY